MYAVLPTFEEDSQGGDDEKLEGNRVGTGEERVEGGGSSGGDDGMQIEASGSEGNKKVAFEKGTKDNNGGEKVRARSINEIVAKSAKFRWVIRVECNIQKGAVFNPRKTLL
jgi:hypothetical protein